MSRAHRIELIKKIEQARNSKVIAYITSDRPDLAGFMHQNAVYYMQKHLMLNGISSDTNVDLLLYSRGGDTDAPWSIMSMLREYCGNAKLGVLIPYKKTE